MKFATTDKATCALQTAWLAWAIAAATINHLPQPVMSFYFMSPLTLAVGVALGRRLADRGTDRFAALAMAASSAYVLLTVTFVGGAGGGPLGYANANAALGVQLLALAALLALNAHGLHRAILLASATLSAVAVWVAGSEAAIAVSVPLIAAIVVAFTGRVRRRWWSIAVGAFGVAAAAATVTWLTLLPQWPARLINAFSTTRHQLWNDALTLWAQHPLIGAGPGAFERFSPLAKSSKEYAMAHMSLLQIGAETGLFGVALFTALVAAGFVLAARARPALTLVVSAALAALLIHSFVDHILEYWPIILVTGAILGYASHDGSRHHRASMGGLGSAESRLR